MDNVKKLQDKLGQAIRAVRDAQLAAVAISKEPESSEDYSLKQTWRKMKEAEQALISAENSSLSIEEEEETFSTR